MGKKPKNKAKDRPSGGEKLPRCARCSSLVKDMNAAADGVRTLCCPGCQRIFCKRCEAKLFSSCPNGDTCIAPMSRCTSCVFGMTFQQIVNPHLKDGPRTFQTGEAAHTAVENIRVNGVPIGQCKEKFPFISCGNDGTFGCNKRVCDPCSYDKDDWGVQNILSCSSCFMKIRCRDCIKESIRGGNKDNFVMRCSRCNRSRCVECTDWHCKPDESGRNPYGGVYTCDHCYWSAKPCTNPDCHNEVGIPTKRCGDCHRNRYCSKACQIIMRSSHKEECAKMMKKREERAERREETAKEDVSA